MFAYVRYWRKADIGLRGINVCFGGKAGIIRSGKSCLLLNCRISVYSLRIVIG
jgi:hypothetical protein